MGKVVVGNYPGSIPGEKSPAKRNCPATGTGSGLTHCFLFGQSGEQRSTTLAVLSFFSGTHFSPRRQSFAQFPRFGGIWWYSSLGFAPAGAQGKRDQWWEGGRGMPEELLTFTSSWSDSTVSASSPIPNAAKAQPTPTPLTPHRIPGKGFTARKSTLLTCFPLFGWGWFH